MKFDMIWCDLGHSPCLAEVIVKVSVVRGDAFRLEQPGMSDAPGREPPGPTVECINLL